MSDPTTPPTSAAPSTAAPAAPPPSPAAPRTVTLTAEHVAALRAQQNLPLGVIAGLAGALIGAVAWALITVTTEYEIGYMAVAIGFLVGYGMRLGKGLDKIFGITGAILALLGCVFGNLLSLIAFVAKQEHLGFFETLGKLDYSRLPDLFTAGFSAMDLVFYGIAVYEGYRFSFRRLSAADLEAVSGGSTPR